MNVKAYTPAKHKVFFLSLWFILFAGIILGIMLLFTRPVNKADAAYRQLLLLENQLVRLNAMNNELLVHFDQEDDLFSSGRNRFESEMSKLADEITITLEQLKRTGFLRKKRALSRAMHDLSELFSDYRKNLNDLLATLRERGNEGSGLLSRWQKLSDGMLKAAAGTDENTIIQLQNIKQLEYKYMIRKESRILGEVSDMAEDIRGRIMAVEGGIQVSDLDNYIGLTSSLISLNKRLYDSAGKGIQEITKKSYDTLVLALEKGDRVFLNRMERARLHESIVKYLVLAAFVTFAIFLAIMIVRAMITAPLEGIMASVQKLAAGDLSDAEIKPGRLPELIAIKEFLLQAIRGFQEKLSFTRSINQGSLDISLADLGKADDLGRELVGLQQKLVEDAKEQTKNNEENLRRRYINEGLAKFADILRGKSNDIELLGDSFIREMVKYLNAIQGGFFVYDDSDPANPVLKLIAAFAYNRKKYLQKTVSLGEGLVGTCAMEKQPIHLTEVPADYILITSGLGDAKPDNLMLIPVIHENVLLGVLEIASLNKFKDFEITFADEVAKSLGSTIIYTRNNQKTAELLAKSQQQALEMAEQEEEMRQNMEELKATQEESSRREAELQLKADAIENALFVIDYDPDGKISGVNDMLCRYLGTAREEIIGRLHHEVFDGEVKPDGEFWKGIQRQNLFTCFESIRIGRKSYRLKNHFTAVRNQEGSLMRYMNFMVDVTDAANK